MPDFVSTANPVVKTLTARMLLALAGMALVSLPVGAAGLGELRVRSALGERFDAVIPVTASGDEHLSTACFQLLGADAGDGMRVLRRARLDYRPLAQGGELRIRGGEHESEPLLKVVLRLRCPEDDARGVTREYSVLLDPREFKAEGRSAEVRPLAGPVVEPPVVARTSKQKAAGKVVTKAPQEGGARRKSKSSARQGKPVESVSERQEGEFSLRLATAPLDAERAALNLSDEEKLKLRERALLLESDDQTAQLMQLKDRIARLEKQLVTMTESASRPASTAAASAPPVSGLRMTASVATDVARKEVAEHGNYWLWGGLVTLLLAVAGFFSWRWWQSRRESANAVENIFDFDLGISTVSQDLEAPHVTAPAVAAHQDEKTTPQFVATVAPVAEEWSASALMDVVQPETVAEEVQLLLEHGMVRQGIDLLLEEIKTRPQAVVLWMKLFEACRLADDKKLFAEQAVSFHEQFLSDALWTQVQAIGRSFDPTNPLYLDTQAPTLSLEQIEGDSSGNDDFDFPDMVWSGKKPKSAPEAHADDVVALEFHLPGAVTDARSEVDAHMPMFSLDAPTLELPPQAEAAREPQPEDFVTEDPQMQAIARQALGGQRDLACQQLEELLYRGNFEQRMLAAKWLDRLLPVRGS